LKASIVNSRNEFILDVEYETFKPEIGYQYDAIVLNKLPEGIIAIIENTNIRLFVQTSDCITENKIKIILEELVFKNGKFSGLAKLV
jgi:hypothetical protein